METNDEEIISPSTAAAPDLDWTQIRETVRMLNLAVAQIGATMQEGDDSICSLTNSFSTMVGNIRKINAAVRNIPDSAEKNTIRDASEVVASDIEEAIILFQFYDKLAQRLNHVSSSLAIMSQLIFDSARLYDPYEWKGLQERIKSGYPLESDKVLFDAILNGATVEEALRLYQKNKSAGLGRESELVFF